MPSPIGHSLASLAVSRIAGQPVSRGWAMLLVAVGLAPDLDLLWARHSMETHSLGAAALAGLLALLLTRNRRLALVVALVWFTHPLMDALGDDSSAPFGVMLWWPFSREFYLARFSVFDSAYRAYWKPDFWPHNIVAVAKEILILAPILVTARLWRRRSVARG